MNKNKRTLSDVFYDSFDYILILIIIVLLVVLISWRLNRLFTSSKPPKEVIVENKHPKEEGKDVVSPKEEPLEKTEETIELTIESGSSSQDIAHLLKDRSIIQDEKEFLDRCESLGLASKLRAGKFTFTRGQSLEDIINILVK